MSVALRVFSHRRVRTTRFPSPPPPASSLTRLTQNYNFDMSLKLETPNDFPAFPFQPYEIQLRLMQHLYASIEDKKVTIVESPTGTVILSLSY